MEKLKVIIKGGMHMLLTPLGQEVPRITYTAIAQGIEPKGTADVMMLVDERLQGSCKIVDGQLQMPDGEVLPVMFVHEFQKENPDDVGKVHFKAEVEFPFDTNHVATI